MTPRKLVRLGRVYVFSPCLLDVALSQHYRAVDGQRVRVVNLSGAPRANTMGQCHIEDATTREFLGMVSVHSLTEERTR